MLANPKQVIMVHHKMEQYLAQGQRLPIEKKEICTLVWATTTNLRLVNSNNNSSNRIIVWSIIQMLQQVVIMGLERNSQDYITIFWRIWNIQISCLLLANLIKEISLKREIKARQSLIIIKIRLKMLICHTHHKLLRKIICRMLIFWMFRNLAAITIQQSRIMTTLFKLDIFQTQVKGPTQILPPQMRKDLSLQIKITLLSIQILFKNKSRRSPSN